MKPENPEDNLTLNPSKEKRFTCNYPRKPLFFGLLILTSLLCVLQEDRFFGVEVNSPTQTPPPVLRALKCVTFGLAQLHVKGTYGFRVWGTGLRVLGFRIWVWG